ncbi:translesion error-prone DNA polymerase V autoproteolytic subunit [Pseudomonas syringae]|nr:translesion error-prone DNA polymerase V autoproteolytic subunit [Pseudomonas syringae]MBD8573222.1 translesion error-prone DNA polymerase V autoproteolytic subunit [Pseudomonas syringae]MBD8790266.1 translesion error-prone DNA polymerase V autoproteolytic subunit [Pseudomonas syringae]MBD8799236.1 translesion error-prone DNA polymerase V autoproteolytic subunit [Pseudomonas syringae]MBD8810062.1 translesion error-prone DNA polymerase V autoproteolytic subunit [Pseudomonas syringae]
MSVVFLGQLTEGGIPLPLYSSKLPAGFPSPAADHVEKKISLDELFDVRAPHVYIVQIQGDSMQGAGIFDGDLAIVDCSRYAEHNDIVVALLNAEPLCKRLHLQDETVILKSENSNYPPRHILEHDELTILGVVKYSVRDHDK